jgi:predicted RNA-binding Zn-ribbon protein involved in translation (DUF1610 family)
MSPGLRDDDAQEVQIGVPIKQERVSILEPNNLEAEFRVESKQKLASRERRAKAMAMMEENATATLGHQVVDQHLHPDHQVLLRGGQGQNQQQQNQHVKKAKLLAEHRETLQRTNNGLEVPLISTSTSSSVVMMIKEEKGLTMTINKPLDGDTTKQQKSDAIKYIPVKKKRKKSDSHTCPICGYRAKAKDDLNSHLSKEHQLEPPFRCTHPGCKYETIKLQSLLNHTDVHSQDTRFHCPAENCTFSTTTIHRLKFHKILHSGNVYPCEKCNKRFTHKSSLSTHQLVHDAVKRIQCKECDFSTKYRNHLATHMRIHRGEVLRYSSA